MRNSDWRRPVPSCAGLFYCDFEVIQRTQSSSTPQNSKRKSKKQKKCASIVCWGRMAGVFQNGGFEEADFVFGFGNLRSLQRTASTVINRIIKGRCITQTGIDDRNSRIFSMK